MKIAYCSICNTNQMDKFLALFSSPGVISFILNILVLLIANVVIKNLFLRLYIGKQFKSYNDSLTTENIKSILLDSPVFLKSSKKKWLDSVLNLFFVRWHFFSNINSYNSKNTIKTFFLVVNLTVVFIIISNSFITDVEISLEKVTAIGIASLVATYWHSDTVFYRKWKHCADICYKYLELDLSYPHDEYVIYGEEGEEIPVEGGRVDSFNTLCNRYAHALVVDLLYLDLWAHKSFYRHFNFILYQRILNNKTAELAKIDLLNLVNNRLTERDIEVILRDIKE